MNDFLASGGDNFTELKNGKNRLGAMVDVEAFNNYLKANAPVAAPAEKRITA